MPPAVIGGAIAAVGAIGGAAIGASGAKSAANASARAAEASAAEQRAARTQAYNTLQPYIQAGIPATQQINALLGLPTTSNGQPVGTVDWASYVRGNPDALANWNAIQNSSDGAQFGGDIGAFGAYHYNSDGARRDLTQYTSQAVDNTAAAQDAFSNFRNSTGYDFRVKQGMNAVNSGYAGSGTIKSGAAIKAANDYGQGMATQEFGNHLNALGNQQSLGYQAGSSAAGVGTQAANSLGSIYMQNGANQANAALAGAQNTANALNSITSIGANIFGKKA